MFSSADKTIKSAPAVQQKTAGASFFRKAGEGFFGAKENSGFFGKPIQAKLTVSTPDDPHEKEADAVADKVMRMPEQVSTSPLPEKKEELHRKEEEEIQPKLETTSVSAIQCKEDKEEKLDAKLCAPINKNLGANSKQNIGVSNNYTSNKNLISLYHSDIMRESGRGPPTTSIPFEQSLASSKGRGSALPGNTQNLMESRFNADFSGVRVHTDSTAVNLTTNVNAQAFAHGNDIYFNSGKYSPDTTGGRRLLAHELTHTIQQNPNRVNKKASLVNASSRRTNTENNRVILRKQNDYIHRAPASSTSNQTSAPEIDLSNKSGGSSVPDDAKEYFRHSLNADVSDIRIHTDEEAANICRSRRVPAFTQGSHICFDPARYSPGSEEGGKLLAKQISASLAQRSIAVKKANKKEPGAAKPKQAGMKETPSKDKKKGGAKGKGAKGDKKKPTQHKEKKKADKSDWPPIKSVKADPKKSPSHPDEDPAFQKVVGKTKATAKHQKEHEPAESKATDAQKASPPAPKEAESKAQERKTDGIDEAGKEDKPFDAEAFKRELLKKIEDVTPKTLEDATEFKENNKIGEVKNVMGNKVSSEKQDTTAPVANASKQPLQVNDADNKHPVPLPPTPKGPKPAGVGAQDAAPKPKLDNEISLQEQSKSLDAEMKANNVTEDQLAKSNEPSFTAALDQKKAAQKDAVEKPKQYRKDEKLMLTQAKAASQEQSAHALAGMDAARGKNFASVVQHQQTTKDKDHLTRADVAKNIETKYLATEARVNKLLDEADKESNRIFDEGAEAARVAFENYVDAKMRAYKRERYSGFWGGLSWLEDKLFGMPDEVNVFYTDGRQMYLDKMDQVITQVANFVTAKLNEAKQAIKNGKKEIDDYVHTLPESLADVGKQAASDIQDKFDSLEQSVNDKKDQLIEGLAKKYVDNVKKIDERISEMKEANAGLIDKAIGFLKKVWKVIKDLVNLFTSILSKLASIVGVILDSPGGFFDNLGKAFKQGFNNFKDKFLDYLEQGLMDWLMTNLGISGVELPKKFTPMAIFTLVLQVLGLTKQHIKERAIAILGPKTVAVLETAGGILYRVATEGIGVLWEMIQEKLTDLKEIVWEAIKSYIKTKVVEAAIIFLLSMLNPVGAFVKLCMAIYDFLMMLVRFKDRIMELLDSILNAVMAVASGAIDSAANAIEKAFAKSIPVIIGFLAALLHLNDIAAKVRDIITRIRARVDKAIDFVINKGVGLVKGVVGLGKKAVGAVAGWLGFREKFKTKSGINHTAYIQQSEGKTRLVIESTPVDAVTFFSQKEAEVTASTISQAEKNAKIARIKHGRNLLQGLNALMNNEAERENARIPAMIAEVISIIKEIDPSGSEAVAPGKAVFQPGFSMSVKATSFSARYVHKGGEFRDKNNNKVTVPANHSPGSEASKSALPDAFRILEGLRLSDKWTRFHILNADFGGVGVDSNLIPTPGYINNPEYLNQLEVPLKSYYNSGLPIWLRATISYRKEYNGVFPLQYTATAGAMKYQDNNWVEDSEKQKSFDKTIDMPATSTFDIHEVLRNEGMAGILVKISTVTYDILDILRRREPSGGYKNVRQMERAIEQEFYGQLNREFTDFPAALPQPTPDQKSKAENYKRKLNSVNYTF
jgi:hypothetical protein